MKNKKLEKKLQEWAEVSSIYEVCYVIYQNGKDIYAIYSNSTELKHFVYIDDRIQEWAFDYMYSHDKNRDKVIIKELNKVIKAIKEHSAYLEYLSSTEGDYYDYE